MVTAGIISVVIGGHFGGGNHFDGGDHFGGGTGPRLSEICIHMIHRFMTSHPVPELLLCFRARHKDGRPMLLGFLVIFTHRLTELCTLNAENV